MVDRIKARNTTAASDFSGNPHRFVKFILIIKPARKSGPRIARDPLDLYWMVAPINMPYNF